LCSARLRSMSSSICTMAREFFRLIRLDGYRPRTQPAPETMRRFVALLLCGLHYLQATAAPCRPGARIAAFAGPSAPLPRCALRPGSAVCGRVVLPQRAQRVELAGVAGARGYRAATCALVQGGAKEMHEDWVGPPPELKDTIYAQSTALGMGGIAVIRVSGPDALVALQRLSRPGAKVPKPRYATLRTIVEPDTQQELDSSLVLFFPGAERVRERDLNICMYIKELNIYSPRAKYIYICTHTHTHTHTCI